MLEQNSVFNFGFAPIQVISPPRAYSALPTQMWIFSKCIRLAIPLESSLNLGIRIGLHLSLPKLAQSQLMEICSFVELGIPLYVL